MCHMQISSCADIRQLCQYTCSYELSAINSVTRGTGMHNLIFLAYVPEQICMPNCTNTPHCISTIVYI